MITTGPPLVLFLDKYDDHAVERAPVRLRYGDELGVNVIGQAHIDLFHAPIVLL